MMPWTDPLPEPDFVMIDGARIATRVLEPTAPSAGDVVLCHGTPWSSQVWAAVARGLSRDHRVHLWDMPGYGRSDKAPALALDLAAQSRRLVALLQHWALDRPHLIAHDIGAAVALRAHLLHGVEYADLFLWDGVVLEPWGSPFFRLVAEHADVFAALPDRLHGALVAEYIAGALGRRVIDGTIDELARPWTDAEGKKAFYRQIATLDPVHTRPLFERLGEIRCPVRIGWGADDPWIPIGRAYALQGAVPARPQVVELAGVGHLAPVEDPDAVNAAVREWLESCTQPGVSTART